MRCVPERPFATVVRSCSRWSGPPNGVIARTSSSPGSAVALTPASLGSAPSKEISKFRSKASQSAGQFWPFGGGSSAQLENGTQVVPRSTTSVAPLYGPPDKSKSALSSWKFGSPLALGDASGVEDRERVLLG